MAKNLHELMDEVNTNIGIIKQYKDNNVIKTVLWHACNPEAKFLLPDGTPPFKNNDTPDGLGYTNIYQLYKKFYVFCRADVKALKREEQFISALEGVSQKEASVLLLIKDQRLHDQFPNLVWDKVKVLFE
jgi:hypothetical protein